MSTDTYRFWRAVLDELEVDVAAAERTLLAGGDHDTVDVHRSRWSPPTGAGPLPAELRPRAEAVLARQVAVVEALAAATATVRYQIEASDRFRVNASPATPVYVDRLV